MKDELKEISLSPGLYLVATPIGNLGDVTLRGLQTLMYVDIIYCEDTRQTKKLLNAYQIQTKTAAYHDHSSEKVRHAITTHIKEGKAVALVSDAGMPLISDPGYKLVRNLIEENIPVTSVPGANAVLAALQLSGLPSEPFMFLGFLPPKEKARRDELKKWKKVPATLIFYEAKQRVVKTLKDIKSIYDEREICVVRELTKMYEEVIRGNVETVLQQVEARGDMKGEFVILISPAQEEQLSVEFIRKKILDMLAAEMPVKKISEDLSDMSGWSKKDIYNLALELKKDG